MAGELLSPSHWYWALIATFVIYLGTSTRGQTLTKGWQLVVGTVIGVGIATLIASLVGGNVVASLALIFVALFTGSYLGRVSYAVLIICVISMLALLFGLLGEFTIGLLLFRLEETAVGAAIGIGVAFLILPARTVTGARANIRSFLHRLADLVAMAGQQLSGQGHDDLLGAVWELDQQLAAVRTSIERLTDGMTGLRSRSRASWVLTVLASATMPSAASPGSPPRSATWQRATRWRTRRAGSATTSACSSTPLTSAPVRGYRQPAMSWMTQSA